MPRKPKVQVIPRATGGAGLFDELIVDNFAGGGGASIGIEEGFGRAVDIAINHNAEAIAMHSANHPHTLHYQSNVWEVDPVKVTGGRPVGLAWFSPDCTQFSRAKGGKPIREKGKKLRCLAWVVIRWARKVTPRVIMLENVREFADWGPLLPNGRPCPIRKGATFRRWLSQLKGLGYDVEMRVLNAADYGAATHRRRFFLIARADGKPIVWPEPTHGPGRASPYRTAAECIDWTLPCHSIFLSQDEGRKAGVNRPLAHNTMRRIAMGLRRFVLESPRPFIVRADHGGAHFRGQAVERPLATITGSHGFGVVTTQLSGDTDASVRVQASRDPQGGRSHGSVAGLHGEPRGKAQRPGPGRLAHDGDDVGRTGDRDGQAAWLLAQFGEAPGQAPRTHDANGPVPTITPRDGGGFPLAMAYLDKSYGKSIGQPASDPAPTQTPVRHTGIVAAHVSQYYGNGIVGKPADDPLPTITPWDHNAIAATSLVQYNGMKGGEVRGCAADAPVNTITPEPRFALSAANLVRLGQTGGNGAYSNAVDQPLTTITSQNEHCLAAAYISRQNGARPDGSESPGRSVEEPSPTATGRATQNMLAAAYLGSHYGDRPDGTTRDGHDVEAPHPTITAGGKHSFLTAANLVHMNHGEKQWSDAETPLRTILAGANHHGLVKTELGERARPDRVEEVRSFLTKFYGTAVGQPVDDAIGTITPVDRFGLVNVQGQDYQIVDIGLRMLTPRELFRCQGFPESYQIEVMVPDERKSKRLGRPVLKRMPKDSQCHKVGNSVPPAIPRALVRANFPDECVAATPKRKRRVMEAAS